ncbi:hypothetical protein J6590_036539 [Homalodisca vitripennis]|nr:hypothetical protein J6590_036539 [Homalodisca vitripennis]
MYWLAFTQFDEAVLKDMRAFWTSAKSSKSSADTTRSMHLDDRVAEISSEKCALFARFFIGLCSTILDCTDTCIQLDSLYSDKSCGLVGISPMVLRYCSDLLAFSLSELYNASIAPGVFSYAYTQDGRSERHKQLQNCYYTFQHS